VDFATLFFVCVLPLFLAGFLVVAMGGSPFAQLTGSHLLRDEMSVFAQQETLG
jgi:hypothetical protein